MIRRLKTILLAIAAAVIASIALAHSDGIYNPSANNVGNFEGIDSNKASGSLAPPALAFTASVLSGTGGGTTTLTWTGVNLGTTAGFTSRRIIVIQPTSSGNTRTMASALINGVSADFVGQVNNGSVGAQTNIAQAIVPSGTAGVTVSLTYNDTQFGTADIDVFAIDDALLTTGGSNHAPTMNGVFSTSGTTSGVASLNIPSGGAVIGIGATSGIAAGTFTTDTANVSANTVDTQFGYLTGMKNNSSALTPAQLQQTTAGGTGIEQSAVLLVWR